MKEFARTQTIPCNANCPWKLNAYAGVRSQGKFRITEVGDDHTCSNPTLQFRHKHATVSFVAKFILPSVKTILDLTALDVRLMFSEVYHTLISYKTA